MATPKSHRVILAVCYVFVGFSTVSAAAQTPPRESKGQNAKELCAIDLTAEIVSGVGRRLRMRSVTLEPGGIVAVHGHQDRPTVFLVTKGTLLSHVAGTPDQTLHAGGCLAEGKAVTSHWMENKEAEPAEYIAVDVAK
jgi:quercetin dioxygenase-like cupin family protein